MENQVIWDKARRLIQAATGDEYGDGLIVDGMGEGFSEGVYGTDTDIWVKGDWNPKRFRRGDEPVLTNEESLAPRLGNALDRIGVELLWLDEWQECMECYKAVRTEPDSYSWTPQYVFTDIGDFICSRCATFDDIAETAINNPEYAVPTFIDLEDEGFTQLNGHFESGWFEGQNDNPKELIKSSLTDGYDEIAFSINSVGQFDVRFNMFGRKYEDNG